MPKSQRGYISFILIIFLLILSFLVFPRDFPKIKSQGCEIGNLPTQLEEETVELPKIIGRDNPNDSDLSGFDPVEKAQYKLIRKKALIASDIFLYTGAGDYKHMVKYDQPVKAGLDLYYPYNYGEINLYRDLPQRRYPRDNKREILMRREGLIFFIYLNPDGTPQTFGTNYMTDVYQDLEIYNLTNKGYDTRELFICPTRSTFSQIDIEDPSQFKSSDKSQLQLQWFLLKGNDYLEAHCKPAIYLYPKEKTLVNVKVHTKGFLTYVDPPYDQQTGWNVTAYPSGQLTINNDQLTNKNYPYLYYESKLSEKLIKKPTQGWVVEKNNLEQKFNEILPKLGLNKIQISDFVAYWTKSLPDSPYYFIGLISQENLKEVEPLEITPKPDFIHRVRVYFEPLDQPKPVAAPDLANYQLPTTNYRFHAVEWGGMVKRHDGQYICSE